VSAAKGEAKGGTTMKQEETNPDPSGDSQAHRYYFGYVRLLSARKAGN
jgi:hypothetical protein